MELNRKTVSELTVPGIYFDDTLKGFGVRVRTSADGKPVTSWIIQYRIGKKQRRQKLGDVTKLSDVRARKLALSRLGKVAEGIDPAAEKDAARAANAITVRSVLDQYLPMKEKQLENDSRRASSLNVSRLYLAKGDYFKPLHNKPINAVTKADIATRLNAIILNHSANTASRARAHLSAFFVWAMQQGIAEANPVIGTQDPEGAKPRDRVLKDHELAAVWNACKDDEYGKIVKLLMLSGCRRSEIGKACWSWLDLEQNTMTIPSTVAKNHRANTLPLTSMMRSIIGAVPHMVDRDPLFGIRAEGFTGWQHCHLDVTLAEPWKLHDIRRSVATGMADLGILPHIIEVVLNHASGHKAGVAGVYNKSSYTNEVKEALKRWSNHIAEITGGTIFDDVDDNVDRTLDARRRQAGAK
jgi:integrase